MAVITEEERKLFQAKFLPVKDKIQQVLKKEKDMLVLMRSDNAGIVYKKLLLCEDMIYVATLYMCINNMSLAFLSTKNNDSLNDARKMIYKAIIYLEDVVTNKIDCPYSELEENISKITNVPIEKRLYLIRKLGLAIQLLADSFGDNSKWVQSFVEMRGRFVTVAKNLIDMTTAVKDYFDPYSNEYDNTVLYIRLIRKLLDKSANEYRDRYELSTKRLDDMRIAISYLIALRRIAMLLNDNVQSEEIKKKALVWRNKLDADIKSGASK